MKILDEPSFDFVIDKKTNSSDIIKQSEETCCSHSNCDENSKIKTQKIIKSIEIAENNELEDLSHGKKLNKIHDSHKHKHSHSEHDHDHEHENCESTHNIHEEHSHSHDHDHDHNEEHDHNRAREGIKNFF